MAGASLVDEFIRRLANAERKNDPNELAELFAENAVLVNLTRHHTVSGNSHITSAKAYWSQYLHAFSRIHSHITHVLDDGHTAVLEWRATGELSTGTPVDYCGVSLFEYENQDESRRIVNFRTYYDSAALLPYARKTGKLFSESVGQPEITNQATS